MKKKNKKNKSKRKNGEKKCSYEICTDVVSRKTISFALSYNSF